MTNQPADPWPRCVKTAPDTQGKPGGKNRNPVKEESRLRFFALSHFPNNVLTRHPGSVKPISYTVCDFFFLRHGFFSFALQPEDAKMHKI
jgi:hypothetical protein